MSSPFTFNPQLPGQPASSPFASMTFPYPSPAAPSPLAGLLAQGQSSPTVTFGYPGTPQTFLSVPPGPGGQPVIPALPSSNRLDVPPGASSATPSEISLDVVLRGVEEALGLLNRLESAIQGMILEQQAVFTDTSASQSIDNSLSISGAGTLSLKSGSPARIMALQQEYAQTLFSLQPLLTSTLIGALPIPLTSALPNPPDPASSSGSGDSVLPTIQDLTVWAEKRAELEFSRREGVKAGAKAVFDAFKR